MKICTIGCGGHSSDVHGPSQQKLATECTDLVLAACCDIDILRAEAYQKAYGFNQAYNDIDYMLEQEKPDAVFLIAPVDITSSLAIPILQAGIPLFLEKPPGLSTRELDLMTEAAEKSGTINMVAFNRRFMPIMQWAIRILEAQFPLTQKGQIDYTLTRTSRADSDFSTTAIHAIDAIRFLVRSPYNYATFQYQNLNQYGPNVAAYTLDGTCQNGSKFHLTVQPYSGQTSESVSFYAAGKTLNINLIDRTSSTLSATGQYWKNGRLVEHYEEAYEHIVKQGFYEETRQFVEAVRHGKQPVPSLSDCKQQVQLMELIRERRESIQFHEPLSV